MADEGHSDEQVPIPSSLTHAAHGFVCEYKRIWHFVGYVTHMATSMDERSRIAIRALYKESDRETFEKEMKAVEDNGAINALRQYHRPIVLEMMLARGVENFLTYLSELLSIIFKTRPETLKSSETVKLDFILKHSSMEELIHELAEKRVNQLAYQGMRDLVSYLSDRLKFRILLDGNDLEGAVRIIECRNLIVHNRGIVNSLFVERTGDANVTIGKPLAFDFDDITNDLSFLAQRVFAIDALASEKFGVEAVSNDKSDIGFGDRTGFGDRQDRVRGQTGQGSGTDRTGFGDKGSGTRVRGQRVRERVRGQTE